MIEADYAENVVINGTMLPRAEVVAMKRAAAASGGLPKVAEHAPSPVAFDGSKPLRAQGNVSVTDRTGMLIVVEQQPEGWKIVEERVHY